MKSAKLNFFDEVKVNQNIDDPALRGKIGIIMGVSENDGVVYGYSIGFKDLEDGYYMRADEISPTGRKFKREDFYDGSRISVSHDGKILPPK